MGYRKTLIKINDVMKIKLASFLDYRVWERDELYFSMKQEVPEEVRVVASGSDSSENRTPPSTMAHKDGQSELANRGPLRTPYIILSSNARVRVVSAYVCVAHKCSQ